MIRAVAHPFTKRLEKALAVSSEHDNRVTKEALALIDKGYPEDEITGLLEALIRGLIDDTERRRVCEAYEEITGETYEDE